MNIVFEVPTLPAAMAKAAAAALAAALRAATWLKDRQGFPCAIR